MLHGARSRQSGSCEPSRGPKNLPEQCFRQISVRGFRQYGTRSGSQRSGGSRSSAPVCVRCSSAYACRRPYGRRSKAPERERRFRRRCAFRRPSAGCQSHRSGAVEGRLFGGPEMLRSLAAAREDAIASEPVISVERPAGPVRRGERDAPNFPRAYRSEGASLSHLPVQQRLNCL